MWIENTMREFTKPENLVLIAFSALFTKAKQSVLVPKHKELVDESEFEL